MKTFKIIALTLLIALAMFMPLFAYAETATVAWDYPNPPAELAGFRLYRSTTTGGPYTAIAEAPAGARSIDNVPIPQGDTYYVLTAWSTDGLESPYSAEALAHVDPVVINVPTAPGAPTQIIINVNP